MRYLRQPEVIARVGVSWVTLWRWEKQDRFPKRRRLGPNTVAWVESEIDEWCADHSRLESRSDA
jgi:prophage regulatory protein